MAIVRSGASTDDLTIDATSKAARVSNYDIQANLRSPASTYVGTNAGAGYAIAVTQGAAFFVISGSPRKTVSVERISITNPTLTANFLDNIVLERFRALPTGGTVSAFNVAALDSTSIPYTATLCQGYTAAPTSGTNLGRIGSIRAYLKTTVPSDTASISCTTSGPFTLNTTTNLTTLLTSAALFDARVVAGMGISGTGIPGGTTVSIKTDTSNLTMSAAATDATTTTRTFTPVVLTNLTSAALFQPCYPGMSITGTGIPASTTIVSITSTSALVMNNGATDSTTAARSFSPLPQWPAVIEWDFSARGESSGVTLRSNNECLQLSLGNASSTAITLGVNVRWIEK